MRLIKKAILIFGTLSLFGAAMNATVMAFNGWKMPVPPGCRIDWKHCQMSAATDLNWLADRFKIGNGFYSSGDFLIWLGAPPLFLLLAIFLATIVVQEEACKRVAKLDNCSISMSANSVICDSGRPSSC